MRVYIFILVIFISALFSCKTKKNVEKQQPKTIEKATASKGVSADELLFSKVVAQKNWSNELSFSSEADYADGKQSVTLNIDVSAKRDQYIYLNAKALGIVNVARVLIKPDSIRILDLVNRTYISASYSFLRNFSSAPMGFEQLQNLTWANAMYDPKVGSTSIDSLSQYLILILDMGGIKHKANYDANYKTQSVALSEQAKSQQMLVKFNDFKNVVGFSYPHEIVINIQGEKKIECKFSITNFATNIKKEPQFVVPKSYKVKIY